MTRAPFDSTLTVRDEEGREVRYLKTPLDQTYLVAPAVEIVDGMLPPEDFEVRDALATMQLAARALETAILFGRYFRTSNHNATTARAIKCQHDLKVLVNRTPAHKAAIRRIVATMSTEDAARAPMDQYIA